MKHLTYYGAAAQRAWWFHLWLRRDEITEAKRVGVLFYNRYKKMKLPVYFNHLFFRAICDIDVASIGLWRGWPVNDKTFQWWGGGHDGES